MNLSRLRELHAAWQDGSIRTDELTELRDMLPEVIEVLESIPELPETCPTCESSKDDRFGPYLGVRCGECEYRGL